MNVRLLGILLILGFGILTAGKEVIAANIMQQIPIFHLLFYCFSITLFFSTLVHRLKLRSIQSNKSVTSLEEKYQSYATNFRKFLSNWKPSFFLNISTALSWSGFFISIKYVEPAIAAGIITSIGPILVIFVNVIFRKNEKIYLTDVYNALCIGAAILYLAWAASNGSSGVTDAVLVNTVFALIAALVAGLAFAFSSVYAKKLNDEGWSSSRIMANRYYAVLILASVFAFSDGKVLEYFIDYWAIILIISFFGILIPLYMLQFGIQKCEPFIVSLVVALGPVFTLFFEAFDERLTWSNHTMIGVFALVLFSISGIIKKLNQVSELPT